MSRYTLLSPQAAAERIAQRHGKQAVPRTLPKHIEPYARFMLARKGKTPSRRDIIKAYAITRSSVQRGLNPKRTVCRYYPEFRTIATKKNLREVRPEDAFAHLLQSRYGKRYLDAAQRGRFDYGAARAIADRMGCFGLSQTLFDDMRAAVTLATDKTEGLQEAYRSSPEHWIRYVQRHVPGVSAAKAGFFAALLGRGDIPTFDAREIKLWLPKGRGEPKVEDVLALRDRIEEWPIRLPKQYEAFKQHLVHHALWDAFPEDGEPTKTTHASLVRAMQLAGKR